MQTQPEGRYLFPHTWDGEGDRLAALSRALDPITKRTVAALGLADGWRCLEVGAGAGSIARWLSDEVGPKGRVLATDLSLALMTGLEAGNLELRRHDIVNDPLPDEEFDLIHCRLVLEHLPARAEVLARLAGALAPGGWLVIEEMTFSGQRGATRKGALAIGGLLRGMAVLMQRNGFSLSWGREVPIHLRRAGLTEIGAVGTQLVLIGGTESIDWARPSLRRFRQLLVDVSVWPAPVQRAVRAVPAIQGLLARPIDALERLLDDPDFVYLAPSFVSSWGRRPPEG
ncbi:MAG TPA: methyltransferase domain-containing protein [Acidimicrobiia bacterium]|nr:methyltransferase domain-containing protein [Acidimicrobiia bacterium]